MAEAQHAGGGRGGFLGDVGCARRVGSWLDGRWGHRGIEWVFGAERGYGEVVEVRIGPARP